MNWEMFIIIGQCIVILYLGFRFLKIAKQGWQLKQKLQKMNPEDREKFMVEARKQKGLPFLVYIDPVHPITASFGKTAAVTIIVIFSVFLVICVLMLIGVLPM